MPTPPPPSPTLRVLPLPLDPVLRTRVPEMAVAVDDEVLLAVLLVHICLLCLAESLQVEADVLRCVLGVGEHDDAIVEHSHPPVMGGHDLLEIVIAEVLPAQCLGALVVVDL